MIVLSFYPFKFVGNFLYSYEFDLEAATLSPDGACDAS